MLFSTLTRLLRRGTAPAPISPVANPLAVSTPPLADTPSPEAAPAGDAPATAPAEGEPVTFFEDLFQLPEDETTPSTAPDPERTRSPRRTRKALPRDPLQILTGLALDAVWPAALTRDADARRPLVLVVQVPSAGWVGPVREALATRLGNEPDIVALRNRPREGSSTDPDLVAARTMIGGHSLVGITPDLSWLAPVVTAAADHTLVLAPLSPSQIGEAIRLCTGRPLKVGIGPDDIVGLDLLDIASALRPQATPATCRRRLLQASRRKVGPTVATEIVPLTEMIGAGEAQAWALDLVAAIRKVKAGALSPALLAGGILYGPPGTGKTTIARGIAAEAGVVFCETSVGSWFSHSTGYLDGVIKQVDKFCDALLAAARGQGAGTAIGFLDEIDALPNRARLSDRAADWWLPVVTHCLTRVEALRRAGVVLIGATNDITRVDSALLRPGRFDRHILVPPPEAAGRLAALRHHLKGDLAETDLTPAVRLSQGATGAVLAGAVRAARRRAEAENRAIRIEDLLSEIAPADTRPADALRSAALHEAGHAIVALRLGLVVEEVTIEARGDSGGTTTIRIIDPTPDRKALERQVIGMLAGRAADAVLGTGADAGAASDLREATRVVAGLHASLGLGARLTAPVEHTRADELLRLDPDLAEVVERDLRRLQDTADLLVKANRAAILGTVEALLRSRVLTGEEVASIARAHPPRVRVRASTAR